MKNELMIEKDVLESDSSNYNQLDSTLIRTVDTINKTPIKEKKEKITLYNKVFGKGTVPNSVFVIMTATIFIIGVPYSFREAGWGLSVFMILFSWLINWFTCDLMVRCAIKEECYNYIKLSHKFGKSI